MAGVPAQGRRCSVHPWCTVTRPRHDVHVGEVHALGAATGPELHIVLEAEGDCDTVVHLEATFEPGGPVMELAELDPAEAVELAGVLLRLARVAQSARHEAR